MRIRVICGGCGIEYRDEHGNIRHMLKTSEDGPFDCEEAAAARLVSLGVAAYADGMQAPVQEGMPVDRIPAVPEELSEPPGQEQEEETQEGWLEEKQLRVMKIRELEGIARNMGLDTGKCAKKDDYVELILAAGREEDDDEEEEPPLLNAEVPV